MPGSSTEIIIYGTVWCFDSRRARSFFDKNNIPYTFIDIDKDPEAAAKVKDINKGFRSVPTILFPDGSILVEPSEKELQAKFAGYIPSD